VFPTPPCHRPYTDFLLAIRTSACQGPSPSLGPSVTLATAKTKLLGTRILVLHGAYRCDMTDRANRVPLSLSASQRSSGASCSASISPGRDHRSSRNGTICDCSLLYRARRVVYSILAVALFDCMRHEAELVEPLVDLPLHQHHHHHRRRRQSLPSLPCSSKAHVKASCSLGLFACTAYGIPYCSTIVQHTPYKYNCVRACASDASRVIALQTHFGAGPISSSRIIRLISEILMAGHPRNCPTHDICARFG
jgi:hypothetical protein